jgi:hypothetical protein
LHGAEWLGLQAPALRLVLFALVVDRKPGFLERLQVAPNRSRGDLHEARQLVNRHADTARFDFAQDLPLADDFGVAHEVVPADSG